MATLGAGGIAAACCGVCGWLLWSRESAPPAPPAVRPAPPPPPPPPEPTVQVTTADEPTILAHVAEHLTVFQLDVNPNIKVLDFPTLRMQGEMLNRVASLIEKAGLPRNRVLTDAQLTEAIRRADDTVETYYYGHDYRASAVARLFSLADQEHVPLDPEEQRLHAMLRQFGWFRPGAVGALISVTRTNETINQQSRATILHHELSHGQFFTDDAYASHVQAFWTGMMTEAERAAMRRFLGSMDYDTSFEELMYNEMQAYMMFTYDPRFFLPENVEMTAARRLQLQSAFLGGMPESWLKLALARHVQQQQQAL